MEQLPVVFTMNSITYSIILLTILIFLKMIVSHIYTLALITSKKLHFGPSLLLKVQSKLIWLYIMQQQ